MITWIVLAVVFFGALIFAAWHLCQLPPRGGRHARLFADPGEVPDTPWLRQIRGDRTSLVQTREVHHDDWTARLGAAGCLPMLPPDPPPDPRPVLVHITREARMFADPADTAPQPVVICELGMPTEEYLDGLFEKYAEVTS